MNEENTHKKPIQYFDPFSYFLSTSTVVQKIQIPGVRTLQSLAFGGKCLDILFVVTTGIPFSVMTGKPYEGVTAPAAAGLLYKITGLGVKGRPAKKLPNHFAISAPENSLKSKIYNFFYSLFQLFFQKYLS